MPIPFPRKSKKWLLLLLPLVAALGVLVVGNVADYYRYRYIMNLDKHLAAADFEAMVESLSSDGPQPKSADYSKSDMPAIFGKIGTMSLSVYRGHGQRSDTISARATLYKRSDGDDWRIFGTQAMLDIDVHGQNKKMLLQDSFTGRPRARTLWVNDPAREEQINPMNRILTLYLGGRRLEHSWIILPDAIIYSRGGTRVRQPITEFQSDAIKGAVNMIPSQTYGKFYLEVSINGGERMEISFSPRACLQNAGTFKHLQCRVMRHAIRKSNED